MKSGKITESEISEMKISSLPTRPSAPPAFGGRGYSAERLKEAFDALPLYIIQKYNDLIGDILGEDGESIADGIKTGIKNGHTLTALFSDIASGAFAGYLNVLGDDLTMTIATINLRIKILADTLGITFAEG